MNQFAVSLLTLLKINQNDRIQWVEFAFNRNGIVKMRIIQTFVDVIVKVGSYRQNSPEDVDQKRSIYKRIINFAICNSCYWSASCLKLDRFVLTCHICGDDRLEFTSLTEAEAYTFDRDDNGV
jgi:hypothetical protein